MHLCRASHLYGFYVLYCQGQPLLQEVVERGHMGLHQSTELSRYPFRPLPGLHALLGRQARAPLQTGCCIHTPQDRQGPRLIALLLEMLSDGYEEGQVIPSSRSGSTMRRRCFVNPRDHQGSDLSECRLGRWQITARRQLRLIVLH